MFPVNHDAFHRKLYSFPTNPDCGNSTSLSSQSKYEFDVLPNHSFTCHQSPLYHPSALCSPITVAPTVHCWLPMSIMTRAFNVDDYCRGRYRCVHRCWLLVPHFTLSHCSNVQHTVATTAIAWNTLSIRLHTPLHQPLLQEVVVLGLDMKVNLQWLVPKEISVRHDECVAGWETVCNRIRDR